MSESTPNPGVPLPLSSTPERNASNSRPRGVVSQWVREHMVVLEATFGGLLAAYSVVLTIHAPNPEHRMLWVTATIVTLLLFVAAVFARSRIDNRDKEDTERKRAEFDAKAFARIEDLIKVQSDRMVFAPEPATSAATSGAPSVTANDSDPDISLRFEPPNGFVLRNYGGHAVDVTIDPVTIEEYVLNDYGNLPIKVAEQKLQFPTVDVDAGESKPVTPIQTYFGAPLSSSTMLDFLKALLKKRQIETLRGREVPTPENSTVDEYWAFWDEQLRQQNEPVDVPLTIGYCSRSSGKCWIKTETVHYEPKNNTTDIKHEKPPYLLVSVGRGR